MKYKPGDKLNVMQKSCCGKLMIDRDVELIEEINGDTYMPIWDVRLDNGEVVRRYLYPEHEIKAAMEATA
jgi:hypothetical protein